LFKGLETEDINSLINSIPHRIKQFSNKEVLAYSGEKVEKAIILLEGKLQGEMIDFAGNSLKIEEMEPPQMIAAAFLYGPQSIFPVNLSAISEGKMLIIYKNDFTQLLSSDQRVLNNYLLQNLKTGNQVVIINQSQKGLAEMLGVARPSLARTISEMEADQFIKWERNQVTILNLKSLQALLA